MSGNYDKRWFSILAKIENRHFWYKARRNIILKTIRKKYPPPARFLEIGCGIGNIVSALAETGYESFGGDLFMESLNMGQDIFKKIQFNSGLLPFKDDSFDIIGIFDVLEHLDNERNVLLESYRGLKPNGLLIITVPARKELWSEFDIESFHRRRYVMGELSRMIEEAGFRKIAEKYLFFTLYYLLLILRRKISSKKQLNIVPVMNELIYYLLEAERILSDILRYPVGTSLLITAIKK